MIRVPSLISLTAPRKRRIPYVHHERPAHMAIVADFDSLYPQYSPLFYHCPNGGKRGRFEGKLFQLMGVRKGIPDLFLAVPRGTFGGFYIELKYGKNKLSPEQKRLFSLLKEQRFKVEEYNITQGHFHVIDAIKEYLDGNQS